MNRLSLTFILLAALSCSKKNDEPALPPCAIAKLTITEVSANPDKTDVYTYEYDADLRLTKVTQVQSFGGSTAPSSSMTYQYTNGMLTSVTPNNSTPAVWTNESGHVVKIEGRTGPPAPIQFTTLMTYDTQGRMLTQLPTTTGTGGSPTYLLDYGPDGNLLRRTQKVSGLGYDLFVNFLSFDGKNNPFALLAKAINQPNFLSGNTGLPSDLYFSKNNPVTSSENSSPVSYTYEYNSFNYPTKITEKHSFYTDIYVFEYKTCK